MWVLRNIRTPRVTLRRILPYSIAAFIAVFFASLFFSQPTFAENAIWEGTTLKYDDEVYAKEATNPVSAQDSRNMAGKYVYTWIKGNVAKSIFITADRTATVPQQDKATIITYDFKAPNTYTNERNRQTINVERDLLSGDTNPQQGGSQCSGDVTKGLGWILCPVSNFIAGATDMVFDMLKSFLEFSPLVGTDNSIYEVWAMMRSFANVVFVIVFIIIIYSQITSAGISNYGIKAMLPRLILAAILVNSSYWICAVAVDAFNVIGNSIQNIFMGVRENIIIKDAANISWTSITTWILGAGAYGTLTAGSASLALATAGNAPALFLTVLLGLISALTAAFVALAVLAIRQALIAALIIISPLAFVAYVLPNTDGLFKKWRETLTTLLVFFPLFSLLFGASQVVGTVLINRGAETGQAQIIILGLVVQVIVFIITPLIMKLSSGLLGRFAGMVNDTTKGPIDQLKNGIKAERDHFATKSLANPKPARFNPARAFAKRVNRRKIHRENLDKANQEQAAMNAMQLKYDKDGNLISMHKDAKTADTINREAGQQRKLMEGHHERNWNNSLVTSDPLFNSKRAQHEAQIFNDAKDSEQAKKLVESGHQVHWNKTLVAEDPSFSKTRFLRENASMDNKRVADDAATHHAAIYQEMNDIKPDDQESRAYINKVLVNRFSDDSNFQRQLNEQIDHFSANALQTFAMNERKAKAMEQYNQVVAEAIDKNELEIHGRSIQEFAAGARGEAGRTAVRAKAKKIVSEVAVQEIKDVHNALADEVQISDDLQLQEFKVAANNRDRIARMIAMNSKGGPGQVNIAKSFEIMQSRLMDPSDTEITQEVYTDFIVTAASIIPDAMGKNEVVKRMMGGTTNSRGERKSYKDVVSDPAIWRKLPAQDFIQMAEVAQEQALRVYATAAQADSGFRQRYELFIEKLKKDPNYGRIKDNIAELVEKDIDELALSSDAAYAGPVDASRTSDIKPDQFIDYDTIMANVNKYNRNSRS